MTNLLDNLAPCSLLCYSCTGCNHGVIKELSEKLLHYLDGYDFLVEQNKWRDLQLIRDCMRTLDFWSKQSCPGCRHEDHQCHYENCFIRNCTRSKGHDFCAECDDFPCEKVREHDSWLIASTRIREVGAAIYFCEEKYRSQYSRFKKGNV